MASILDRYGIKEVADVTFYKLDDNGKPQEPVLYLDTLKVSTIEQTAENTSARGGKGNPELILWDYGKEITVTLEDALFSAKSMAVMFGSVNREGDVVIDSSTSNLRKTVPISDVIFSGTSVTIDVAGNQVPISAGTFYDEQGSETTLTSETTAPPESAKYFTFDLPIAEAQVITISAETFPGTYYITGDTYARRESNGEDEFFQFIIPKAKVLSEVTLTMEAEGDPSTFSMNVKVLRPSDGKMMKLVKYNIAGSAG